MSRIVLLTEGHSNPADAKTATGVLRYRGDDVVAILDSECAGRTAGDVLGVGGSTPFIASLAELDGEALGLRADTLLIGIAPTGGRLPDAWRQILRDAIGRRLEIWNGLHLRLSDDPEFRELAARHGVRIWDVRQPPEGLGVSMAVARELSCFRVHTVGQDCSIGKMVTSLEVWRALRERGYRSEFVATGQTGILIKGSGLPIDAVVSDFVAGATESMVIEAKDSEFVVIEGQGCLMNPMYSGVTLGLLHGASPQAMLLVWDPTRTHIRHTDVPIPPMPEVVELYERMASLMAPSRVVAVALNTSALDENEARRAVDRATQETGLPATDVLRFGVEPVVDAVLAERSRRDA